MHTAVGDVPGPALVQPDRWQGAGEGAGPRSPAGACGSPGQRGRGGLSPMRADCARPPEHHHVGTDLEPETADPAGPSSPTARLSPRPGDVRPSVPTPAPGQAPFSLTQEPVLGVPWSAAPSSIPDDCPFPTSGSDRVTTCSDPARSLLPPGKVQVSQPRHRNTKVVTVPCALGTGQSGDPPRTPC